MSDEPVEPSLQAHQAQVYARSVFDLSSSNVRNSFSDSYGGSSFRIHASEQPKLEPLPAPEPVKEGFCRESFKGQLLLKLLEIESSRCSSKEDEEERTDALAMILEGDDNILNRIQSGMAKYMNLLGIEDSSQEDVSSVWNKPRRPGTTLLQVDDLEVKTWDALKREVGRNGFRFDRLVFHSIETNRGGRGSPEDQITCTFSVLR